MKRVTKKRLLWIGAVIVASVIVIIINDHLDDQRIRRRNLASGWCDELERALLIYKDDYPSVPITPAVLRQAAKEANISKDGKPLLDPWGHPYELRGSGTNDWRNVWSAGPDGKSGTKDDIHGRMRVAIERGSWFPWGIPVRGGM